MSGFTSRGGEDDSAQNGDENREGSELEGIDEILEEQIGERFGGGGGAGLRGGLHRVLRARDGGGEKTRQRHAQRNAGEAREFRQSGALFYARIEQHDEDYEAHHERAAEDEG